MEGREVNDPYKYNCTFTVNVYEPLFAFMYCGSYPWDSPVKNTGVGCHFLLQCMKVKSESEVAQSCLTLSDPMDCSLSDSSVHGIFQARVLEWGAIAFSMTNLDSIFKSRDITLPTKVRLVKAMVFPVVTYGCQSWTVKKAER